jgi:hypothetical protein
MNTPNNKKEECKPNCDFDNSVRFGRADWRCKDCGRQLMLELVLMKEPTPASCPSWEVEFDKEFERGCFRFDMSYKTNPELIKAFLKSHIQASYEKGRAEAIGEVVKCLPKAYGEVKLTENITPDEQAYDDGHNDCLETILSNLKALKK